MAEPETEAGSKPDRLVTIGDTVWHVAGEVADEIAREAARWATEENVALREALRWTLRNDGGECPADYPLGYAKALRALGDVPEPPR